MPSGWYGLICCICFTGLTPDDCAVDWRGDKWDTCKGACAIGAGCFTEDQRQLLGYIKWHYEHDKLDRILESAAERGDI